MAVAQSVVDQNEDQPFLAKKDGGGSLRIWTAPNQIVTNWLENVV
jgi:hypothetical protein